MACERTGRRCYGLELDPIYCDVIVRRWLAYSGGAAQLASTAESFDAVAVARRGTEANGEVAP
jgi:DNA modification methylase